MRKKIIYIIIVLLIGYTFYGVTYSKYVSNSIWDYYLKAKGFYFTSDYLKTNSINNANNLWDGENIHFSIKNHLNQKVVTSYDINYTATCEIDGDLALTANCYLNGTNQSTIEGVLSSSYVCNNATNDGIDVSSFNQSDCNGGGYEWVSQTAIADLYFNVVSNNNEDLTDVIVNIDVTSTSPYTKSLKGKFILHKGITRDKLVLDYSNFSNYDRLNISNHYLTNKCVELNWDSSKVLISLDNNYISYTKDANDYVNGIKLNIAPKESISYIFYSQNINEVHTVEDFTIIEATGC